MYTKNAVIGMIFLLSFVFLANAQENTTEVLTKEKRENILKFMNHVKADEMPKNVVENIIQPYQTAIAAAPLTYWDALKKSVNPDTLINQMVDVYHKAFTNKEIIEINKFMASDAGKKFILTIPAASNECWQLAAKWANEIAPKIKDKIMGDGYMRIQR